MFLIQELSMAQIKDDAATYEIALAKKFIIESRYQKFLAYYPNLNYFLTTGESLRKGPAAITTYIHEASHVFDNIMGAGAPASYFYWQDSTTILSTEKILNAPTTDGIFNLLPDTIKDQRITQTYILCEDTCMSRKEGIYGLLEEFNSYSVETSALVDIFIFFDTCTYTNSPEFWSRYLNLSLDYQNKFYYFSIFFSMYIKHVSVLNTSFYKKMLLSNTLKGAFRTIYNNYIISLNILSELKIKVSDKIKLLGHQKDNLSVNDYSHLKALADSPEIQKYLSLLLL